MTTTTPDMTQESEESRVRRLVAPVADPAAVGLAAFGLTTFVLSVINVGAVSDTALPIVAPLALAYGGLVQLLAGMWAFKENNTFAAVALSSYGGFWLSFWALNAFFMKQIPANEQADALALYLIAWGIFTTYLWVASFRTNVAINLVLLTLIPAYLLLGIGKSVDSTALFHIGGAFGIATAILAWYTSFAITTNNTFGRTILPVKEFKR
jgi:succinate-acetate transporter protein